MKILWIVSIALLMLAAGTIDSSVHAFDAEFGFSSEDGFGGGDFAPIEIDEGYFVHDTLEKLLLLLAFTLLTLVVYYKARARRRLLLVASVLVLGFYTGGFLCPIPAVQNLFDKYHNAFLLLLAVPTALAIGLGRLFCGYICPFGAIQELLQIQRLRRRIPALYQRRLQVLKYVLLGYLVIRMLAVNDILGVGLSPFRALFTFGGTPLSIALTVFFGLLSIVLYRPFCQFLCPLGAFLGLVSRSSKRTVLPAGCTGCGQCNRYCQAAAIDKGKIRKSECFLCGHCADSCWIHTRAAKQQPKHSEEKAV